MESWGQLDSQLQKFVTAFRDVGYEDEVLRRVMEAAKLQLARLRCLYARERARRGRDVAQH